VIFRNFFNFALALITFAVFSVSASAFAEELYPELDCPSRTPIIIAGSLIGAALVYEMIAPNLPQQNGITFFTSLAVGGLAGGFAGAVYAQKSCQSRVSFSPGAISVCYDF